MSNATFKILFILLFGLVFVHYSSVKALEKAPGAKPYHKFEAGLAIGYSSYDFDKINNYYIKAFAREYGIINDYLDNNAMLYAELGYRINKRISIHTGFYLMVQNDSGTTDYTYLEVDDSGFITHYSKGHLNNNLNIDFISPYIKVKYRLYSLWRLDMFASSSGGFSYGRAQITSEIFLDNPSFSGSPIFNNNKFTRSYSDYNFAYSGQIGIIYKFNKEHSVVLEGGYHDLSADPLTDEYGNFWIVGGKGPQLNLDIKGWAIGLGYYYHFW